MEPELSLLSGAPETVGAEDQQGLLKLLIEVDVELCMTNDVHVDAIRPMNPHGR